MIKQILLSIVAIASVTLPVAVAASNGSIDALAKASRVSSASNMTPVEEVIAHENVITLPETVIVGQRPTGRIPTKRCQAQDEGTRATHVHAGFVHTYTFCE